MANIESTTTASNLVVNKINSKDYLELVSANNISDTELYEINFQDQIDDIINSVSVATVDEVMEFLNI